MLSPINSPARGRAQLVANNISIERGTTKVLNDVNLTLNSASRVAIVGENGTGKTTLLHILAGKLTPDSGVVSRIGTLSLAEQEMDATDHRTVGQAVADAISEPVAALAALDEAAQDLSNGSDDAADAYATALEVVEALDAWDAERRIKVTLEAFKAESDMSRPLADLSVGQRYRVRLACLLGTNDDFLLLDEPTNHLDHDMLNHLTQQLQSCSGGVVVVSHDRALLSNVAETFVDLDPTSDGHIRIYGGGYEGYRNGRESEWARWNQEYDQQQSELARLQDSLSAAQNRLVSRWRPEKGTNKHGRATRAGSVVQSVHRRQVALDAHKLTVPPPPQLFTFPDIAQRNSGMVLRVEKISKADRLTAPVSFTLTAGDRLVVTGPNGSGKSTLLSIAARELEPDSGVVHQPHGVRLGFLHQETVLPKDQRANDVYQSHMRQLVQAGKADESAIVGLSQLGLLGSREAGKRLDELSMGQLRRLDLALVLATRPHVLLLDEPTNHLSIALVDELTEALQGTLATVLLSTHDRQLLQDVADWPQLHLNEPS